MSIHDTQSFTQKQFSLSPWLYLDETYVSSAKICCFSFGSTCWKILMFFSDKVRSHLNQTFAASLQLDYLKHTPNMSCFRFHQSSSTYKGKLNSSCCCGAGGGSLSPCVCMKSDHFGALERSRSVILPTVRLGFHVLFVPGGLC